MERHDGMPKAEPEAPHFEHKTFELPDWLPRSAAAFARSKWVELHGQQTEPEIRELLYRLISDPRMRNVWNQFQKRKRESYQSTEEFFYPAKPVWEWDPHVRHEIQRHRQPGELSATVLRNYYSLILPAAYERTAHLTMQDLAIVYFLDHAYKFGQQNIPLVPISEVRKKRGHYLKMAKQLQADAADQERLGLYAVKWMEEAARGYEALATAPEPAPGYSLLVPRQTRGDPRLKSFVILLAEMIKNMFGSPFYGSVATTANVVFSRDDVTVSTVRKMVLSHPVPNRG
jgi:hypothetical protein